MIQFIFIPQYNLTHMRYNCSHHYNKKLQYFCLQCFSNSLNNTKIKQKFKNYCNENSVHLHSQQLHHLNVLIIHDATFVPQNNGHFMTVIKRVILKLNLNIFLNLLFIIAEGTTFFNVYTFLKALHLLTTTCNIQDYVVHLLLKKMYSRSSYIFKYTTHLKE